jgi:hypothetical protein
MVLDREGDEPTTQKCNVMDLSRAYERERQAVRLTPKFGIKLKSKHEK